jgi:hypothetical protein
MGTITTGVARIGGWVRRTGVASRAALRRRDAAAVFGAVTLVYLLGFLYALGDLAVRPGIGTGLLVVEDPLSRALEPGSGPFAYEGVAVVDLGIARYLFSPVNLLFGLGLSALVGLNLALSYLAAVQPNSCGIGAGTGLLASVPALLSGTACCAPVVLLVLGIQASALVLSLFVWLLPIGVVALLASLVYVVTKVDPTALDADPTA